MVRPIICSAEKVVWPGRAGCYVGKGLVLFGHFQQIVLISDNKNIKIISYKYKKNMIMNLHTYKGLIFMKVKTWYRYLYAPTIVYFNHWFSFFSFFFCLTEQFFAYCGFNCWVSFAPDFQCCYF